MLFGLRSGLYATQSDESRTRINRCLGIGIAPVTAYQSLIHRVPDTPIRAMNVADIKLERPVYLSHRTNFLSVAEDYAILELLDQHIDRELTAVSEFMQSGFVCPLEIQRPQDYSVGAEIFIRFRRLGFQSSFHRIHPSLHTPWTESS